MKITPETINRNYNHPDKEIRKEIKRKIRLKVFNKAQLTFMQLNCTDNLWPRKI